jgi:hypothetical protein
MSLLAQDGIKLRFRDAGFSTAIVGDAEPMCVDVLPCLSEIRDRFFKIFDALFKRIDGFHGHQDHFLPGESEGPGVLGTDDLRPKREPERQYCCCGDSGGRAEKARPHYLHAVTPVDTKP